MVCSSATAANKPAYAEAKALLREHRRQLDLIAGELLERETLDEAAFKAILAQEGGVSSKVR